MRASPDELREELVMLLPRFAALCAGNSPQM